MKDLTGQRFGRLTVIGRSEKRSLKSNAAHYVCQCECGRYLICRVDNLKSGHTQNCTDCSWVRNGNKSVFVEGGDKLGIV